MKSRMATLGRFFKKNIYYVLLVLCIAVIATIITVTLVNKNKNGVIDAGTPPITEPDDPTGGGTDNPDPTPSAIIFDAPVRTGEIGLDYSATEFVYSSTLNQFRIHKAIDFKAEAGTEVYAAYEGTVESVSTDILNGTMIVIKHNDELKTVYKSLDREPLVSVGDRVRKGDVIGKVSASACFEIAEGAHLHFEVLKNGALTDPYVYLLNSEK